MKPPPLLLGAALLFWGWQSDFLLVGAAMALVIEGERFVKVRWELSDEDFARIWTFCSVLVLASIVYAFTSNDGPSTFSRVFQNPTPGRMNSAGSSSARTATAIIRWLPMLFFPFLAAQRFSTREAVPLMAISLLQRRRWRKARRLSGKPPAVGKSVSIGYPYFGICLLAASVHPVQNQSTTFFWGLCVLLTWVLWVQRSQRFAVAVWAIALGITVVLGYHGQQRISQLQRYIENFNPQFFAQFMRQRFDPAQSRTMIGHIGEVKTSGRIVVRLEPGEGSAPPTYLRAASYRSYKSRAWSSGSFRNEFTGLREEPANSGIWPILPNKTNTAVARIGCYLDGQSKESGARMGLLPLPTGSGRLENLPAYRLQKNSAGAVLAEGPGLVIFDAQFGPGATIDSPADTNEDLSVLAAEVPALERVVSELNLKGQSTEKVLTILEGFFNDKFTYATWQPPRRRQAVSETPLGDFLVGTRRGHCEYFASSTVLLLRQLGIPARYAVGYYVHERSGDKYVVRLRDAHAWCLVWDKENGLWRDFDTTPASWVGVESKRAASLQWLSDLWSRLKFEFLKFWWGQGKLRQYLLWLFVPVLALSLYQILFRRGRRRHRPNAAMQESRTDWPGLDSEFYLLEKKLTDRGVPRETGESLSDWLLRVLDTPDLIELRRPLQELLLLHYRYRFDPLGLSAADRETLRYQARKCMEALARPRQEAISRRAKVVEAGSQMK
jgi:uncharacterized protein YbdZ (MbtH family)